MNKKFLIFLVLLSIVYFIYVVKGSFSIAQEAKEHIYVTVLYANADVSLLLNGEACEFKGFCPNDLLRIQSNITNIGTMNITGNLSTKIINPDGEVLKNKTWYNINLSVGEVDINYELNYTIKEEDKEGRDYWIKSNFTFDGRSVVDSCEFRVNKGIGEFTVAVGPEGIIKTIPPGGLDSEVVEMWLEDACENATVDMNISDKELEDWTSFEPERVFLLPPEDDNVKPNETRVIINVSLGAEEGYYEGTISAYAESPTGNNQTVSFPLKVNVSYVNFSVKTTIINKKVCQGEKVNADVNITKFYPTHPVDVNMTYQISKVGSTEVVSSWEETVYNLTNSTLRKPALAVPSSAELGYYTFLSILEYKGTRTGSHDSFEVVSCPAPPGPGPPPAPPAPAPPPELELTLNLSTDLLTVVTGNRTSFIATVKNTGTETIESVKLSIVGIPQEWTDIIPTKADIKPGEIQRYLVIIDVPSDADVGTYELRVKATDEIESNVETLTLIIGKNYKEIADLLLEKLEELSRKAEEALLVEDCIDITLIKTFHEDAGIAYNKGLEAYNNGNFIRAINWFEYAIPIEKKVIHKIDISLEMELETSKRSKMIIPPFYDAEGKFQLAENYLEEKNYREICDPIEEIRRFIMVGLIFWPAIILLLIILIIVILVLWKRGRREKREEIIERLKKRLSTEKTY